MSSNHVIIITPDSLRTQDRDVKRLYELLEKVIPKAEDKLYANFKIDCVSDFSLAIGGLDSGCDHQFILTDGSGKLIAPKKKGLKIRCLDCGCDFKLISSMSELNQAMNSGNPRGQTESYTTGADAPAGHPHAG